MKHCRLFIGGLSTDTTEKNLLDYFRQYGQVISCKLVYDKQTGVPKGYGFVTVKDKNTADTILKEYKHLIKGRLVDVSPGIGSGLKLPESHQTKSLRRLFIGGIKQQISQDDLWGYFSTFGTVLNLFKITDPITNVERNYGYVEFEAVEVATTVLNYQSHSINGHRLSIEVHRRGSDAKESYDLPNPDDRAEQILDKYAWNQGSNFERFLNPSQTCCSDRTTTVFKSQQPKGSLVIQTKPFFSSQPSSDLYCDPKLAQLSRESKLAQDRLKCDIQPDLIPSSSRTDASRSSQCNSHQSPLPQPQNQPSAERRGNLSPVDTLHSLKKPNIKDNYCFRMESDQSFKRRALRYRQSFPQTMLK